MRRACLGKKIREVSVFVLKIECLFIVLLDLNRRVIGRIVQSLTVPFSSMRERESR